jgi:hypothetical protein
LDQIKVVLTRDRARDPDVCKLKTMACYGNNLQERRDDRDREKSKAEKRKKEENTTAELPTPREQIRRVVGFLQYFETGCFSSALQTKPGITRIKTKQKTGSKGKEEEAERRTNLYEKRGLIKNQM